jgi:deferrochelatase/peroxidase EfeB
MSEQRRQIEAGIDLLRYVDGTEYVDTDEANEIAQSVRDDDDNYRRFDMGEALVRAHLAGRRN